MWFSVLIIGFDWSFGSVKRNLPFALMCYVKASLSGNAANG